MVTNISSDQAEREHKRLHDPIESDTRCTAHAKATGQQCRRRAVKGMTVCVVHGGKTPTGVASPHYKTGTHVRNEHRLPQRFVDEFRQALASDADDLLLDLAPEIALLDVRIGELISQLDTGESASAWREAGFALQRMKAAMAKPDPKAAAAAMDGLERLLIEADQAYDAKWGEIQSVIQQRTRVVEAESKRRVGKQETMTAKEARWLFLAIMSIIKARVHDRATLAGINADINGLVAARMRPGARAGDG